MAKVITDEQYMDVVQKFFKEKLKQFREAGGWDVVNEKAQHCTYNRYLETGIEDCENTAKLIESLIITLEAVKHEMQAEVECLEARIYGRTNFIKLVETIDSAMKKTENISEKCAKNRSLDDNPTEGMDQIISLPSMPIIDFDAPASRLQVTASTSKGNQNYIFRQTQEESTSTLVPKLCRPPASLTGSFTVDQDEDTITFLEPMHVLTFQDTTMDDTARGKDNVDQVANNSIKESVRPVRISEPPAMKSELAKRWIREVSKKMF